MYLGSTERHLECRGESFGKSQGDCGSGNTYLVNTGLHSEGYSGCGGQCHDDGVSGSTDLVTTHGQCHDNGFSHSNEGSLVSISAGSVGRARYSYHG
jgi:hypothetical protein